MTQIKATYVDHMGTDLTVVNAARVSFGNQISVEMGDMFPVSWEALTSE